MRILTPCRQESSKNCYTFWKFNQLRAIPPVYKNILNFSFRPLEFVLEVAVAWIKVLPFHDFDCQSVQVWHIDEKKTQFLIRIFKFWFLYPSYLMIFRSPSGMAISWSYVQRLLTFVKKKRINTPFFKKRHIFCPSHLFVICIFFSFKETQFLFIHIILFIHPVICPPVIHLVVISPVIHQVI